MQTMAYTPFKSDLVDLAVEDLAVLRDVGEGWYIEYKSQVPSTENIAKSISAFANHYGGWLFYGIKGTTDGTNRAESFPGLDDQSISSLVEALRNAVKDRVAPAPYYDYKLLKGPCSNIGLPSGQSVAVVAVPSGPNPPYVHSSGRIYRRIADASDPKPETDRFVL